MAWPHRINIPEKINTLICYESVNIQKLIKIGFKSIYVLFYHPILLLAKGATTTKFIDMLYQRWEDVSVWGGGGFKGICPWFNGVNVSK